MKHFNKTITSTKNFVIRHKTPLIAIGASAAAITMNAFITANLVEIALEAANHSQENLSVAYDFIEANGLAVEYFNTLYPK